MANGSSRQRGRRGGVKRPAAVSGPGKLSRRTDGAAPSIEDVRGMVNESAGEESALVDQVRQGNIEQPQTTFAAQPQAIPQQLGGVEPGIADVFAPGDDDLNAYTRPPTEDEFLEPDDVMLIRAMAEVNPTAELLGLLKFASDRQIGRTQRNI
tara:strand:+ start:3128 stop:3586 length:459 start_codon:yes stop_codon:yes gene_type:complete